MLSSWSKQMITFDVYSMPYRIVPGSPGGANIHQYLITRATGIGSITIEANTLLAPAVRDGLRQRLEAIAEDARQSGPLQQRIYLRPAAALEPRGWKAFKRLCPGIDI
jgi:hypothetical protein